MKIGIIIQGRMSSQRLPEKVLQNLAGKPLLDYLFERLKQSRTLTPIILATSTEPSDNALAEFAKTRGVDCYRGPLQNVASRLRGACDQYGLDAFVRLEANSPLLDPTLIDRAVKLFEQTGADIVTNMHERTFPHGQSIEVINLSALKRALPRMTSPDHFETVTAYFYEHAHEFIIHNFQAHGNFTDVPLAVNTMADLSALESVIEHMKRPHWEYGWLDLLELYKETASWLRTPLG
jgi:spore coat polysaccharide biosynthesis protein SpsF